MQLFLSKDKLNIGAVIIILCISLITLCSCGKNELTVETAQSAVLEMSSADETEPVTSLAPTIAESSEVPNTEKNKEEADTETISVKNHDFEFMAETLSYCDLMKEACSDRKENYALPFEDIDQSYFKDVPSDLLTDEEAALLLENHKPENDIKREEALEDIDLLFRLFKSTYGPYYYFGESNFENAKNHIIESINNNSKQSFSQNELALLISDELDFLRDGHFSVTTDSFNGQQNFSLKYKNQYYYCSAMEFDRDEQGYYQVEGDKRWYLKEISNGNVSIEPTLLEDGRIVYAPVLLCRSDDSRECRLIFTDDNGEYIARELKFKKGKAAEYEQLYSMTKNSGVSYIKLQSLSPQNENLLQQYAADAASLKDSKLIIYDLRSNGGGKADWAAKFTANLLDVPVEEISLKQLFGTRQSKVFFQIGYTGQQDGSFPVTERKAIWHENTIPIIVLVDNNVCSAGEQAMQMMKTIDNVLVIGSNTKGLQISGNQQEFCLPNTGLKLMIGCHLLFNDSAENIDYCGFKPDIWCNPECSLESVIEMVLKESPDLESAFDQILQSQEDDCPKITLSLKNETVFPEQGIGTQQLHNVAKVMANGKKTKDFEIENHSDDIVTLEKDADGNLKIDFKKAGNAEFLIRVRNSSAIFKIQAH